MTEKTAWEKNEIYRVRPMDDDEVLHLLKAIHSGRMIVMRKPPWSCHRCRVELNTIQWIGDTDTMCEWKVTCHICDESFYF